MKRRVTIFQWIRITVCVVLFATAVVITLAWLIPISGTLENHTVVLVDEGSRYNVYAEWNDQHYNLRALPKGVHVVPHRFVVYLLMVLSEENVDLLSIEYRRLTTKAVTPRHIQLLPNVFIQRFSFAADPQTQGQDGWHLTVPIWLAVMLVLAYPTITLVRGPIRRWRRRRRGLCETCRYDLSGLTEKRCPECGTEF